MTDKYISAGSVKATISELPLLGSIKEAWCSIVDDLPAADVVSGRDFRDCRNELCLRCGQYRERHLGACDGCRWRDMG